MEIISFVMSAVMMLTSFLFPVGGIKTENSESDAKASFLSTEAQEVLSVVVENIVNEAKTGTSDSQEVLDMINSLPVYEVGQERTDRKTVSADPFRTAVCEAAKKLINKVVPDGTINHFLNHLSNGMYDLYIYLVPIAEEENTYFIYCDYVDNYNNPTVVFTGIKYNKETGKL